jgi:hypothetical protein
MITTKKTSHKIVLVSPFDITQLDKMFAPLAEQNLFSTVMPLNEIEQSNQQIETNFLYLYTQALTKERMAEALKIFPELTGVMFLFKEGDSPLTQMKEVAIARTHFVAIIGAIFVNFTQDSSSSKGVQFCRKMGIPYLHQATIETDTHNVILPSSTLSVLANMA